MNWRARLKGFCARYVLTMEFCHDCGERVEQIWTAPDDMWRRHVPDNGPRCIPCFDRRARSSAYPELRELLRWVPVSAHGEWVAHVVPSVTPAPSQHPTPRNEERR